MAQLLSVPRKTPAPVETDPRAALAVRMLMARRGLSSQALADRMAEQGIYDAPGRSTIRRIVRENGVPREGHKRAIAEFFYGEGADPTRIWKVKRS